MNNHESMKISVLLTQVMINGMQEFIGQPGLDHLLSVWKGLPYQTSGQMLQARAGLDFNQISALQQALEDVYGPQGARGVALRSGRAAFCYFLRTYGGKTGFDELDFRLLPPRRRIQTGLERLAQVLSGEGAGTILVQDAGSEWQVQIENCPECWGWKNESPLCYFSIGLLQEFLTWMSGGKIYLVEETACRVKGDQVCTIRIEKKPLD